MFATPDLIFSDAELNLILYAKQMAKEYVDRNHLYITTASQNSVMFLAGGCFTSFINNTPAKDYDLFILDSESSDAKSVIDTVFPFTSSLTPEESYHTVNGDMAYMGNDKIIRTITNHKTKAQYILTKYKSRKELVNHFDMLHCCVSYDIISDTLYISKDTFDAIRKQKIIPNNGNKIADWRKVKMIKRGWSLG